MISFNRLFYDNKLLDGVSDEDRSPIVVSEFDHPTNILKRVYIVVFTKKFCRVKTKWQKPAMHSPESFPNHAFQWMNLSILRPFLPYDSSNTAD